MTDDSSDSRLQAYTNLTQSTDRAGDLILVSAEGGVMLPVNTVTTDAAGNEEFTLQQKRWTITVSNCEIAPTPSFIGPPPFPPSSSYLFFPQCEPSCLDIPAGICAQTWLHFIDSKAFYKNCGAFLTGKQI